MVLKAEDKPLRRTSCLQEPEESGDQQRGQELHTADGQAQDARGQEREAEEPEESADQGGLGPSGARTFPLLLVDRGQDAPEGGNGGGLEGGSALGSARGGKRGMEQDLTPGGGYETQAPRGGGNDSFRPKQCIQKEENRCKEHASFPVRASLPLVLPAIRLLGLRRVDGLKLLR